MSCTIIMGGENEVLISHNYTFCMYSSLYTLHVKFWLYKDLNRILLTQQTLPLQEMSPSQECSKVVLN